MADVSTRETSSLIGSDKVEGTAVYGTDQNKIGTVQRVMIDKLSGRVAYAVVSFGGSSVWARITIPCLGPRLSTIPILRATLLG